jgi:hypothetical protein
MGYKICDRNDGDQKGDALSPIIFEGIVKDDRASDDRQDGNYEPF